MSSSAREASWVDLSFSMAVTRYAKSLWISIGGRGKANDLMSFGEIWGIVVSVGRQWRVNAGCFSRWYKNSFGIPFCPRNLATR